MIMKIWHIKIYHIYLKLYLNEKYMALNVYKKKNVKINDHPKKVKKHQNKAQGK